MDRRIWQLAKDSRQPARKLANILESSFVPFIDFVRVLQNSRTLKINQRLAPLFSTYREGLTFCRSSVNRFEQIIQTYSNRLRFR